MTTTTDEPPTIALEVTELGVTPELNKALAALQAEIPPIAKGNTANTGTYKYDYADLADVTAALLPLLGKHELAFTAWPTVNDDGKFVLAYSLLHSSGQHRDGVYPLPSSGSPQQVGGAITYARRYALCAVTGAAPGGDDTDAAGAPSQQMDVPRQRHSSRVTGADHERLRQGTAERTPDDVGRTTRSRAPDADSPWQDVPPEDQPGSASEGQVTAVQMAYKGLGFKNEDRQQAIRTSEQIVGRELTGPNAGRTHKNLSHTEAVKLRDTLLGLNGDREKLVALLAEPLAAGAGAQAEVPA